MIHDSMSKTYSDLGSNFARENARNCWRNGYSTRRVQRCPVDGFTSFVIGI